MTLNTGKIVKIKRYSICQNMLKGRKYQLQICTRQLNLTVVYKELHLFPMQNNEVNSPM